MPKLIWVEDKIKLVCMVLLCGACSKFWNHFYDTTTHRIYIDEKNERIQERRICGSAKTDICCPQCRGNIITKTGWSLKP